MEWQTDSQLSRKKGERQTQTPSYIDSPNKPDSKTNTDNRNNRRSRKTGKKQPERKTLTKTYGWTDGQADSQGRKHESVPNMIKKIYWQAFRT